MLSKSLILAVAFAVSASAIDAPKYGQCGGDAICPKGYKCETVNSHYSQCVPIVVTPRPYVPRELGQRDDAFIANIEERETLATAIPTVFDAVTGPDGCTGCVHRRNIEVLQASYPTQFNMFILALQALQQNPESADISYYRIAGIHGRPLVRWQQSTSEPFSPPYCRHMSRLFNTWHRPYLSLFEQSLTRKAKAIAATFSGQAYHTYSAAAEQVRLPYWDWAHKTYPSGSCLPAVTMQSTISVTRPGTNGVAVSSTIANPLFQYNFTNSSYLTTYFQNWFSQWAYTRRSPNSSGVSVNSAACAAVGPSTTRRSQIYNALAPAVSYNAFNTQTENTHGGLHNAVGGSRGHMTYIDYSAFDPIFWLHHCNVDRILAMYQATHYGNFMTPTSDLNIPLYPFRRTNGNYWSSDDVKYASSIWNLKYGYDEVPCSYQSQSVATLNSYTRSRINSLYGPTIKLGPFLPDREIFFIRDDFVMRSVIDASEIPGSWTLHAFVGKPTVKPIEFESAKNRIGSFSSFGNAGERKESVIYDNQVPISDALIDLQLDYKKDYIIRNLTADLYYTITTPGDADGEVIEIPISSLKTFKLGIYTVTGNYTDPEKATSIEPVYGTPTYIPECTKGKPGGISSEQEILYPSLLNGTRIDLGKYYD